ncbi:MAG: HAMP domain-containing sensor histidine kinase [Lachnospiraceae bacterium]
MRRSIRRQMVIVFIGIIVFVFLSFLIINGNFLEQYYILNKQTALTQLYTALEKDTKDNAIEQEEIRTELAKMAEKANISFVIINQENTLALSNVRDNTGLKAQLVGYLLNQGDGHVLKSTKKYQICKTTDPRNQSEYIEMWGQMSSGYTFILRSPLESIRESVALSNRFLVYAGVIVISISAILIWFFSKRITDPILELAVLSQKMAKLDFNAKYTSGGENEIGILGSNFNIMSEELEGTIKELKNVNSELQKDIAKKEQIDSMRTEFLGNVSHELKTPISLIQGYAEGLKEGVKSDDESREFYCDVIIDEADKMNQLVKNLLTLNQLEFGSNEIEYDRFNLVELIRGVIQSSDILIQQQDVTVNFLQQDSISVWADEFKVEQIIRNYLSNALHHVDDKKIIEIKIKISEDVARVSVFNTGMPIPKEDLERVWDKFYKVDKAHTREYGGNGIGLSIVKAIMDSFHRSYGVKNYDNGVEFWFEIDVK